MPNKILLTALLLAGAACSRSDEASSPSPGAPAAVAEPATRPAPTSGAPAPAAEGVIGASAGAALPSSSSSAAEGSGAAALPLDASRAPAAPPPVGAPTPAPVQSAAQPSGQNPNEILERAERAHAQLRSMEADFVQRIDVPLLDTTINSRGKLYHRSPDRFAMRFSEPAGDLIVVDGRYGWMYYPSTDPRQVMRCPVSQGGQAADLHREFLSDAATRYAATLEGTEQVGGRSAHALTLIPRGSSPYRVVKIWVDAQDAYVRRFELTERNDKVTRIELSNLRVNPSLADDLFVFTPPATAQTYDC